MRNLTFKSGVVLKKWTPSISWIIECLYEVQNQFGWLPDLVITSVNDGLHSQVPPSRHYSDEAVDVRSKNFTTQDSKLDFVGILLTRLNTNPKALRPDAFYIILEDSGTDNEHFHIQVNKGESYP